MGSTDPIPAESRWTHTLPNFCKTILRKMLADIGLDALASSVVDPVADVQLGGDDGGLADYINKLNGVRIQRVRQYLMDTGNITQLAVLTVVLLVIDPLLYSILGGVDRSEPPAKLIALLDRDTSNIGKVMSVLAALVDTWLAAPGQQRRKWGVR